MASYNKFQRTGYSKATTPKATTAPIPRELEWAAGFLEGEGSFIAAAHCGSHMVSAPQMQRDVLDRLVRLFGGRVAIRRTAHTPFAWQVYGARARGVMMTMYALMSKRRKQQILSALERW